MTDEGHEVGYRKPPRSTRFRSGQSGNPKGRPPRRRSTLPHELALTHPVTISTVEGEQTVTAAEAFLLSLRQRAAGGDVGAALLVQEACRIGELFRTDDAPDVMVVQWSPINPIAAMKLLRMARTLHRLTPRSCTRLEPWLVQAALQQLGNRRLSPEEQAKVVAVTHKPASVAWPDWWEIRSVQFSQSGPD